MNKKVSIIIPVYNGEKYIKKAIESAINQTYKNIEIIVVNDGSTDETEKICKSFNKKIKYFKKENGGVSSALNLAISKMNGDYFSWLSHDDLYYPNKIANQMDYIEKTKLKNVVIYCDYELINENDECISKVFFDHNVTLYKPEYSLLRGFINGISLLIPKKAFDEIGKFDEKRRCSQDYDLWRKIIKKYSFIHLPDVLTKTRIHSNQDTNANPNVLIEGNPLWIEMIEDISDKRKIDLEGSVFNYYFEMLKFLKTTPYKGALNHCITKCRNIDIREFSIRKKELKAKNIPTRMIMFFKKNGILSGFKILRNRLIKRKNS